MFLKLKTDSLFWFRKRIQFLYLQFNTGWKEPCIACTVTSVFCSYTILNLEDWKFYIFFFRRGKCTSCIYIRHYFQLMEPNFLLETIYDSKQNNTIFMLHILTAVFKRMRTTNTTLKLYIETNIPAISLLQHMWDSVDKCPP